MENESAERTILAERGISAPSTNQNSREILYKVELRKRLKADIARERLARMPSHGYEDRLDHPLIPKM
jgi:hypothetical protein